jgi:hypothetical protein
MELSDAIPERGAFEDSRVKTRFLRIQRIRPAVRQYESLETISPKFLVISAR